MTAARQGSIHTFFSTPIHPPSQNVVHLTIVRSWHGRISSPYTNRPLRADVGPVGTSSQAAMSATLGIVALTATNRTWAIGCCEGSLSFVLCSIKHRAHLQMAVWGQQSHTGVHAADRALQAQMFCKSSCHGIMISGRYYQCAGTCAIVGHLATVFMRDTTPASKAGPRPASPSRCTCIANSPSKHG
jgi:hypothetical protein